MRHLDGKARQPASMPELAPNHTLGEDEVEAREAAERRWDEYHSTRGTGSSADFYDYPRIPVNRGSQPSPRRRIYGMQYVQSTRATRS